MNIRRTKILRDLWVNKARTLLVVLSIAVGVAAFGLMITGRIVLERNLTDEYAATNPAQAILTTADFGDDLLTKVRALPEVQAAEGRHLMQAKFQQDAEHWVTMDIRGIADFNEISINRIKAQAGGTYPPPAGQIALERSIKQLVKVEVGDTIRIQTLAGKTHDLVVAGFVEDLAFQPTSIALIVYGYASLPTLEALDEPTAFNQLYVTVKDAGAEREPIEQKVTRVVQAVEDAGVAVYSAPVPPPQKQVMANSMSSVLLILGALGALTLALSGFLVINIMSALIAQQIPQIGILKSLGSPSGQLMSLYIELVLWFGVLGLLLAVPMGLFGAFFLAQGISEAMNFNVTQFNLPLQTVALQVFGAVVVPLLAAAIPIFTGSRITVREAITQSGGSSNPTNTLSRVLALFGDLSQVTRVSVGNTFRRKGRLILTLLALSLAGAMFIALLGIRDSMRSAMADIQNSLNYDVSLTFAQPYPLEQLQVHAATVEGVTSTEAWGLADGRRVYEDGHLSSSISLIAVPPDTEMAKPGIVQGRWLTADDEYVLYINADMLELAPDMALGKKITLRVGDDEREWTIIGVSARAFTPIAYIPYAAFEEVTGLEQQASMLVVRTVDGSPETQSRIESELLTAFDGFEVDQPVLVQGTPQTVKLPVQITRSATTTALKTTSAASLDILIVLLLVMVVLIAVVGGLGLAITMSLNVLERTREIGILRSLGATNGVIRRMVIVEALVIGVVSWGIGAVLSVPLGMWLGEALGISLLARPLDYIFSVPAFIGWLVLVSLIAVVASLLPARNAARLTIRDTLSYIG
jgi:putative ABC transport system permease protein